MVLTTACELLLRFSLLPPLALISSPTLGAPMPPISLITPLASSFAAFPTARSTGRVTAL
ncbi:hypothetical protein D3C80_2208860 [compost metagenome]